MAIRRGTHTSNFTVIPNELINDNSMSLEARGMLILLLSKPEGWQISNAGLVAMLASGSHPVGRDLVWRMLREVVEAGYMVRSQERLPDGTLGPTDYEVHSIRYGWDADQPCTAKPCTDQPCTVKPIQESNVLEPKKELSLKKKRETPAALPPWLPKETWDEWCRYRAGKIGPKTVQKHIASLTAMREQGHDPVAAINRSIESGWATFWAPRSIPSVSGHKTAAHMPAVLPAQVERTAMPENVRATISKLTGHAR
jgi:hypothetical protein